MEAIPPQRRASTPLTEVSRGAVIAAAAAAAAATTPSIAEDDDDDSSSAYGLAIRRIIQRTRPPANQSIRHRSISVSIPRSSLYEPASASGSIYEQDPEINQYFNRYYDYECRSLYSINESDIDSLHATPTGYSNNHHLHRQLETSFTNSQDTGEPSPSVYSRDMNSPNITTGNKSFRRDAMLRRKMRDSRGDDSRRLFDHRGGAQFRSQRRPFEHRGANTNCRMSRSASLGGQADVQGNGSQFCPAPGGRESETDLETKWSWKNLRREFKLSHSESLFHLYQAKLQQSFFVALLILNIIFNLGAIISYCISKYHEMNIYLILMRLASIWVFVSFLVLIWCNKPWMQSKFSRMVASLAVLLAMIFGEASGAICALINDQATPLASIRRTYYLIITNHVFLPYPNRIQSCAATIIITSFEIIVTYISRRDNNCRADFLTLYSIADIIFYASSAMIGFQITFLLEIAIRRTFLNHKYCIQSTYKLNYEKEQQEQLLRSCLPLHLIEEVRGDIRDLIVRLSNRELTPFRPFKHLYVKKYEDVTILYADIVNSMNLTDKLNPAELVETLNELYGRFDELAEKYSCLRIKLLGDCYYCVAGLPEYDQEHAMKSLQMGLGMIKIIQSLRSSRNVDIDMRIGIHSGSVLSGLLGLRKWQFDIWSLDAMKASQMEHNGQPGFVHITQKTLDLISEEEVKRQDLIITSTRQSDDSETTYLISERVHYKRNGGEFPHSPRGPRIGQSEKLKAYIEKLRVRPATNTMDFTKRRMVLESSLKKYREIHEKVDETMKTAIAEMPLGSAWKQFFFIDCFGLGELMGCCSRRLNQSRSSNSSSGSLSTSSSSSSSPSSSMLKLNWHQDQCGDLGQGKYQNRRSEVEATGIRMDQTELMKRRHYSEQHDNDHGRSQPAQMTQHAKPRSSDMPATAGVDHRQSRSRLPFMRRGRSRANLSQRRRLAAFSSPSNKALIETDPLFHLYLICVGLITLSILAIKCLIPGMPIYSHTVIGFAFLLAIIFVSIIYTQVRSRKINVQFRILLWMIISASLTMLQLVDLIVPDELDSLNLQGITDMTRADSLSCAFAWYYTFTIIVAMTATSIFIRVNVWLKFLIHMSTIVFYIIINNPPATMMDTLREFLATQNNNWSLLDHKQELSHLFYISMIAVVLHLIDRQVEYILTLNMQWNEQLEKDRIESETVGQINKMLLENILPPHVLKRYLYNNTVSYDQLYHESHPSCAVMFASIPNYEQFYTENNLNEQGLKCLQVLNEIICDFDQLLSFPCFRSIEKIKTIGSTYMAACFDVARRTSDSTIRITPFVRLIPRMSPIPNLDLPNNYNHQQDQYEPPAQTPDTGGLKIGWSNPLMMGANSVQETPSACSSPRVLNLPAPANSGASQHTRLAENRGSFHIDETTKNNVVTMVRFAIALMDNLAGMNKHAWQDFRLRIGIAIGPVIAGVVGATKPTYDIWGDTVNVASRLESSGVLNKIQVSEQVAQILCKTDEYEVECRGPIDVKGKGRLTTYFVKTPYDEFSDSGELSAPSEDSRRLPADDQDISNPPDLASDDEVEELCLNGEENL